MGDATQVSRLKLRRDKVLEIQWPSMVDPPPQLLKLPGFAEYHANQKLYFERLQTVLGQMVNNLGIATSTP